MKKTFKKLKQILKKISFKPVYLKVFILILLLTTFIYMGFKTTFSEDVVSSAWDGVVANSFSSGNGSQNNPFEISNGGQLAYLKAKLNSSQYNSYNNKHYYLSDNINYGEYEWEPISCEFSGHIDGRGHTIYNFEQTIKTNDSKYGLFSSLNNATIENINIGFFNITIPNEEDGFQEGKIVLGSLAATAENSTISNVSMSRIVFDLTTINNEDIPEITNPEEGHESEMIPNNPHNNNIIGGLIGDDLGSNVINNSYLNVSLNSDVSLQKGGLVGIANDIEINNVVALLTMNNQLYDDSILYGVLLDSESIIDGSSFYDYQIENNTVAFTDTNVVLTDVLASMNNDNEYEWYVDNDNNIFKVQIPEIEVPDPEVPTGNIGDIPYHTSGIDANNQTVYVNNITNTWNYFQGKNVTHSSNGQLPSGVNQGLFGRNNLVKASIRYNGTDIAGDYTGYVSPTENYKTLIYYDYYEINNNGTPNNNSDDYIEIPLIDNPFTVRPGVSQTSPNGKAFNGWITNKIGAIISFDNDYYQRYLKLPVSYNNSNPNDLIPNDISADVYASWTEAFTSTFNGNWNTALSSLPPAEMLKLGGQFTIYNMDGMHTRHTVARRSYYPEGALNGNNQDVGGSRCNTSGGCTYYLKATVYQSNTQYYEFVPGYWSWSGTWQVATVPSQNVTTPYLNSGTVLAGYYRQVQIANGGSIAGLYDKNGYYHVTGNCNTSGGCTYYDIYQYYDSSNNVQLADGSSNYYYLVTRDTNIIYMATSSSSSWDSNKPFTLTSVHNGNDLRNSVTWNVSNTDVTCNSDVRIENVTINSQSSNSGNDPTSSSGANGYFYGNYYNVIIGRGIRQINSYKTFNGVFGGNNVSSTLGNLGNIKKYRLTVESGWYNNITLTNGPSSTSVSKYLEAQGVYGNDIDRISNNNSNMDVYFDLCGSWGGGYYYASSETTGVLFSHVIKSGRYGNEATRDYSSGVYIGGRSYGEHYAVKKIKVEGGHIYSLIGGPIVDDYRTTLNDTYAEVTGGDIDIITVGAGESQTFGNRIVSVTGGQINYSIFGGSNSYDGSGTDGTLDGSSLVYVGGNAIVGSANFVENNETIWNAEAGSVFGIGNGKSGQSQMGSNNNSTVIIDGDAVIRRNVYGGGNFGAVGASTAAPNTNTTNIYVRGGTVKGSVYGGGNNNGAGITKDDTTKVATINLNMTGGTVEGSVYGGSNVLGTIYGTTNVNIDGGLVKGSVYGGGEGGYVANISNGTYVSQNVNVTIGSADTNVTIYPTINGDVYGGSAYGSVNGVSRTNSISEYATNVVVNKGIIKQAVYGGGQGSSSITPYVEGPVIVDINGGDIGKVFGGNNVSGSPNGTVSVNLNGGVVGYAFGGGNNASVHTTDIELDGGTVTAVFGGSNSSGTVTSSNVLISSGTVDSVYGGNNIGGQTTTANVEVTGGTINVDVYGGGDQAYTSSTNIDITNGTISSLYGGGNNAATGVTDVDITGGTIRNNAYGGGNYGEVSGNTNILINNANVLGSLYAGGNGATAIVYGTTTVNVCGNSVIGTSGTPAVNSSVFGGGNAAPTGNLGNHTSSTVNIAGGHIFGNVYGGANTSKVFGTATVNVGEDVVSNSMNSGDVLIEGTVFGGGEANASGSEEYDFSFVAVTDGITVNIDGNNHDSFSIHGSIFGSGNASTTDGPSVINLSNYGTVNNIEKNISIQRTDVLTIKNSHFILSGATDRTNEYSSVLFSLSRVTTLKLANNSSIYLEASANLLNHFQSLLINGATETKATVTIDHTQNQESVTKNVDNRLYLLQGKHLDVATNEYVTQYGDVTGMTFLGLFYYANNNVRTGLYNSSYDYLDPIANNDQAGFINGGYVLGLKAANQDIEIDGYYSNYNNDTITKVDYIDPIEDGSSYMWVIGELVNELTLDDLIASKYSTLGGKELSLRGYGQGNVTFIIKNVNTENLAPGIQLIDPDDIPRVASSGTEADTVMGLGLKTTNSGWVTNGETNFFTSSPYISGATTYRSENLQEVPSFLFYLYHSKNLSTQGNLGTVDITLWIKTQVDDLTAEPEKLVIHVNMNRVLATTNDYEGSITPGREYEMFATTDTSVTTKSSVSAYYSLYATSNNNFYQTGYHRSLVSGLVLPLSTQITLIDLSGSSLNYYYHVINATDVANATQEFSQYGECSYNFGDFVRMGSDNANNHYDDEAMNSQYYSGGVASEEFIVIIDFENTNIQSDAIDNELLIELRNIDDHTMVSVLGYQQQNMVYDLYTNKDATLELSTNLNPTTIYSGTTAALTVNTNFTQQKINGISVYDTNYFDDQLGLKLSLYDDENHLVSGSAVLGLKYIVDGATYYPNLDGTTRINISERVANVLNNITIDATNAKIATGDYTLKIESFASADGIYYGLVSSDTDIIPVRFINKVYGLKVTQPDDSVIIKKETGKPLSGNNSTIFSLSYSSLLQNGRVNISLYRRDYDINNPYVNTYTQVDLQDYVSNSLTTTNIDKEYLITNNTITNQNIFLNFLPDKPTGTYKLLFKLYDSGIYIGEVEKYIIIEGIDLDE